GVAGWSIYEGPWPEDKTAFYGWLKRQLEALKTAGASQMTGLQVRLQDPGNPRDALESLALEVPLDFLVLDPGNPPTEGRTHALKQAGELCGLPVIWNLEWAGLTEDRRQSFLNP